MFLQLFFNCKFLKLSLSYLCVFEGRAVRANSIVSRTSRNRLHEREAQHTIHPDFLKEYQTVLSNYFEDIRNVKGASGQEKPMWLQFPLRNLDPPAPSVANEAPAL